MDVEIKDCMDDGCLVLIGQFPSGAVHVPTNQVGELIEGLCAYLSEHAKPQSMTLVQSLIAQRNYWEGKAERLEEKIANKVIVNEAEGWFAAVSKALEPFDHLAKAKDGLRVAENVYVDADSTEDTLIALTHAMISQAESQVSIAASLAKLASCVSDHDATYHYIRTGKGG